MDPYIGSATKRDYEYTQITNYHTYVYHMNPRQTGNQNPTTIREYGQGLMEPARKAVCPTLSVGIH